jgi:hypothetical protein
MSVWIYHVPAGKFYDATGKALPWVFYSGHDAGLNNPALAADANVGPVPAGTYEIGAPFTHDRLGPFTMRLIPAPGYDMHGRSGFCIHGDTALDVRTGQREASHGCIVGARPGREALWNSGVRTLKVVDTAAELTALLARAVSS